MANQRADSGELISTGKPTKGAAKPPKPPRRFPWRLWLYAIAMTGIAGAGAYFTWTYRASAQDATELAERCRASAAQGVAAATKTATDACDQERKQAAGALAAAKTAGDTHAKELEKQLTDLAKNLSASKEELATLAAQKAAAEKRVAALEELAQQFKKMVETGTLKVSARRGSLVLSLPSEVLFSSGSAELSKQGEIAVLEVAFTLKKFADRRYMVLGHTDDQPLVKKKDDPACTFKDNWELSMARALTVTNVLVKGGMDAANLIPAGAGPHDPIGKDRAKNRRIEIVLLPAISELPELPTAITGDAPAK